jgi:hypothetical protein
MNFSLENQKLILDFQYKFFRFQLESTDLDGNNLRPE